MRRSDDRIRVTHVGSLPRPHELLAAVYAGDADDDLLRRTVGDVVARQIATGIDVVDDGEYSKPDFITYVTSRMDGIRFEPRGDDAPRPPWEGSREALAFPEYYKAMSEDLEDVGFHEIPRCVGPLTYSGLDAVQRDIDRLRAAAGDADVELFLPSIAPSTVEQFVLNDHYATSEEFVFAIADALHEEYRAIVDAGVILQVDDPELVTHWIEQPHETMEQMRAWAQIRVDALNHALRGIPADRVRYHTCYSIDRGPRVHDLELTDIVDLLLKVDAGAYSFEAANPRHEHEWRVWEQVPLPEGKLLIPGFITHSTVVVEHPEAVADRIVRFADVVGRENVIAGADCGFSSFAGEAVDDAIVWAKLGALVDGAKLASQRLWA